MTNSNKINKCPYCGSTAILPIRYGHISNKKHQENAIKKEWIWGGCKLSATGTDYCSDCEKHFDDVFLHDNDKKKLSVEEIQSEIELVTEYHPNGQIKSKGCYDGLVPVGNHIAWYECGDKEYESIELDESIEIVTYWYENGQIKSKGNCADYWKSGSWTEWHENGNKKSEGLYKGKDERDGEWKFWHSNGQLACTGIHRGWGGDGLWVFWDESGNNIHEREYRELELLGVWRNLRKDGCSDELINKYKQYFF